MPSNRTVYRYHFKVGDKIAHSGVTYNPELSGMLHRNNVNRKGKLQLVGFRTTPENAKAWEAEQRDKNGNGITICPPGEYGALPIKG